MAEHIEREKVLELIGSFKRDDVTEHVVDYAAGWNEALEQIESNVEEDIPAADVRLERHGEWLVSGDCYECSECGGGSVVNTNPYCWKCGAKMDGKDGNKND